MSETMKESQETCRKTACTGLRLIYSRGQGIVRFVVYLPRGRFFISGGKVKEIGLGRVESGNLNLPLMLAAVIGTALIVYAVGFSRIEVLHETFHEARHAFNLHCH